MQKQNKTKFLTYLAAVAVFVTLLCTLSLTAFATDAPAEDTVPTAHTHTVCGIATCTDTKHTGHSASVEYTPITQASTLDGVTVTMSGEKYQFALTGGSADAYNVYNFYVDEDVTFWGNTSTPAIKVPAYTTLNICLNGNIIKCDTYDFILTTASGYADINLCDCSEGVVHHGYLNSSTGNVWVQGEEVPEGCTELDLEGGVIQGYWYSGTSSSYNTKALVHLYPLTSETTPVTFNMYGGNIAGHYRHGVHARAYTTFNFYGGRIAGNRFGISTNSSSNAGSTVNMYGGTVSHHIGDTYFGVFVSGDSTFNLYGGEICYNENYSDAVSRAGGVQNYGIMNMYDGSIHHNYAATDGGAVYNNGYLNMYGGSMTYNSADTGSAVYNYGGKADGAFTMTGGSITNNTTRSQMNYCRGAVWLRPGDPSTMFGGGGTFIVSGTPVIKDNVDVLGRAADVFVGTSSWEGKTRISVGALEEGAEIGIFVYKADGLISYNWTTNMGSADPNDYFFSNHNSEYSVFSVDTESGEVYLDICDHDGERTYEAQTGSYHFSICSICNEKMDEVHTETTAADCLNLAYCAVCDSEYGSYSQSNHHESCTASYTYSDLNYHKVTWSKCGYSSNALHTKTTAANCTYANYCGVCKSHYGSVKKSSHIEDENHTCTICKKTACATVLLDGETEPTYYIELNSAFDAVAGKAKITLLRNIDDLLGDCNAEDGDDITLDLNGYNITSTSYKFIINKSKDTTYDYARLTVIGSGKLTYTRAGSRSYIYRMFTVSAQQNSAATGSGSPELIIGGNVIVETTEDYAVPVAVSSDNAAVTARATLKDNAKLISNCSRGVMYYAEPASGGIQGSVYLYVEGGSLVNNAGTALVGYNASSYYYDGSLCNVYIDIPDIVSTLPNTYYRISDDLPAAGGSVTYTGTTVCNGKNYAMKETAVSFEISLAERVSLNSVMWGENTLSAVDGVYSLTTPADTVKINVNLNCSHTGENLTEATCASQAVCADCGKPHGELNDENHEKLNAYGYCEFCQVKITGATITAGQDLTVNYYVKLSDEYKDAVMHFTMSNGKTATANAVYDDTMKFYKFSFEGVPPQTMGDTIDSVLKLGDKILASHEDFSVKSYAQYLLKNNSTDTKLVQLVTDMLYYGSAAQTYRNYKTDALVTSGVTGLGTPSADTVTPTATDMELNTSTGTAKFTAAGVRFSNVNMIYVKLNTTENVTLKVNGKDVTLTDTTFYTDAIYATGFDDVYTFELYENGTLVQTLKYSVKSYVYTMKDSSNTAMAVLAKALYAYGNSAKLYNS